MFAGAEGGIEVNDRVATDRLCKIGFVSKAVHGALSDRGGADRQRIDRRIVKYDGRSVAWNAGNEITRRNLLLYSCVSFPYIISFTNII